MSGILTIVRGLPGAGKSSFASFIWNDYAIVEADKFFTDEKGNYNFDTEKLPNAHAWALSQVEEKMLDHLNNEQYYPEIVVTGTFSEEFEVEPYYALAEKYNYKVWCIIVENRHGNKSIHDVPDDIVEKMRCQFSIKH